MNNNDIDERHSEHSEESPNLDEKVHIMEDFSQRLERTVIEN